MLEVYGSGYINEVSETRKRGKRRHGISKGEREGLTLRGVVKFRGGFSFFFSSSSSFYLALWRRGKFFRERHRRCSITTSRVPCSGCWISTFFAVRHFRFF